MNYSKLGLEVTERFESCRLTAYQDSKGIWTIGWGHTGPEVVQGYQITQGLADYLLSHDTMTAVRCINNLVKVTLTQDEFDALVDFAYNVGCGAFKNSTLLKLLNAREYQAASGQFQRWDEAAGKVVDGLLRRRLAEEAEFNATGTKT